jgi:S-DNA-T family DNA segregation ATPase FtsK/SpoIIIE
MGKKMVKKLGKVKLINCAACKGKGKAPGAKGRLVTATAVRKTKRATRDVDFAAHEKKSVRALAHSNGRVTVTTRDLETGQDFTSKHLTEEQQLARETIEERTEYFGCPGKVTEIRKGPIITLYEFKPAKTTRIRRLASLHEDLALALSADAVLVRRLPGKDTMGIEISNEASERQSVAFRASLGAVQAAKKAGMELPLNLGIDPFGEPIVDDLAVMPHLLIAGSTGSGKSVSLNAIISSLLTVCSPQELEFYMIDPKGIELSHYADIPHMKQPMVTTVHRAKEMLEGLLLVMRMRMTLLGVRKVRDIKEYNALVEPKDRMPRIVCVIDELSDLMIQDKRSFTALIAEIAGMARAAGIHMVVATHRPSVDVLSGKVKVNFPARMAFRVTSSVDSKVIVHRKGAESLLGMGDMIYLSTTRSTTIRIHAPWVPLEDVKAIADRLRSVEAERKAKEQAERVAAEEKRRQELLKARIATPDPREVPGGFGVRRTIPHGEQETLPINFGYLGDKK